MDISVFGLGYVGTVTVGCLARDGHNVIGVDLDPLKIALLQEGKSPVIEEGLQSLMAEAVASGRARVTLDAAEAMRQSSLSFLCVGTPSQKNGSVDLGALERLSVQLGEALRNKKGFHGFVLRSTVPPGTVETMLARILEQRSGKVRGRDFGVCFQPEFMREGCSIQDFDNPPFTVVGTDCERLEEVLRVVFGNIRAPFVVTSYRTAEMLKYCCNAFHALKVTFANEVGRIGHALGVDPRAVMELLCKDTQLNISPAYLKPGFAFGGSCLPKDIRGLLYLAQRADVRAPMLQHIMPSNLLHVEHAIDMVLDTGARSVGMIGLSFKSGTDDMRESPLVLLAERFIGKGIDLRIFDPEVNVARLIGANRRYIEESIPHIATLMCNGCEELVEASQVVVIGIHSPAAIDALAAKTRPDHTLIDLVGLRDPGRFRGTYRGACW